MKKALLVILIAHCMSNHASASEAARAAVNLSARSIGFFSVALLSYVFHRDIRDCLQAKANLLNAEAELKKARAHKISSKIKIS